MMMNKNCKLIFATKLALLLMILGSEQGSFTNPPSRPMSTRPGGDVSPASLKPESTRLGVSPLSPNGPKISPRNVQGSSSPTVSGLPTSLRPSSSTLRMPGLGFRPRTSRTSSTGLDRPGSGSLTNNPAAKRGEIAFTQQQRIEDARALANQIMDELKTMAQGTVPNSAANLAIKEIEQADGFLSGARNNEGKPFNNPYSLGDFITNSKLQNIYQSLYNDNPLRTQIGQFLNSFRGAQLRPIPQTSTQSLSDSSSTQGSLPRTASDVSLNSLTESDGGLAYGRKATRRTSANLSVPVNRESERDLTTGRRRSVGNLEGGVDIRAFYKKLMNLTDEQINSMNDEQIKSELSQILQSALRHNSP